MPPTNRTDDAYEDGGNADDVAADFKVVLDAAHEYEFDKEDDIAQWEETLNRQNQSHEDGESEEIDVRVLLHSILRYNNRVHGTLLHAFIKSSTPPPMRFARWLLIGKPDMIEQVDSDSRTPLHLALGRESSDAYEFLKLANTVCKKATMSRVLALKDVGDHNCLHYAISKSFPWTLDLIKICQSDMSLFVAGNKNGRTPLHLAMIPPAAKQQQAKENRRRLGGANRAGQLENRILTKVGNKNDTTTNKIQSPIQSSRNEMLDKGFNSKYKPGMGLPKNKEGLSEFKDTQTQSIDVQQKTGELRNSHISSYARPSAPASFVIQDVVQNLMKYGQDALWRVDSGAKPMTPYQYRLDLMSEKKNDSVNENVMSRKVNVDLVARDIKEYCLRNLSRAKAMSSLYEDGKEKHIEFDLSGLPSQSISRSDLDTLADHLRFEDTLQYVAIPKLSVIEDLDDPTLDETPKLESRDGFIDVTTPATPERFGLSDVGIIFKWLSERGVGRIFKVIVVDDGEFPHSREVIERALEDFKVETWDWKQVDICSSTILKAAPGVRAVSLYASGNTAVFKGWSCSDGLVRLESLTNVRLIVRRGFETKDRRKKEVDKFMDDFKKSWSLKYPQSKVPEVKYIEDDQEISLTSWIQNEKAPVDKQPWFEHMDTFATFIDDAFDTETSLRRSQKAEPLEDIRVAIIDDGIDGFDPSVSKKIEKGVSFCRPLAPGSADLVRSYYVSSGGHGTMMAKLVSRICPPARLYIARLQEYTASNGKRYISPESATEAIKWATTKKVHIISMSWTIEGDMNDQKMKNLKAAIDLAKANNIIMMCAFSDQGFNAPPENTFPIAWVDCCCRIGAATPNGNASTLVPKSQVDYLFPGENIVIDAVLTPSNQSLKAESGSSISTALASGTAAMLLLITQMINPTLYEKMKNPITMKKALGKLCSDHNPQYLDATRFSLEFKEWIWEESKSGKGWEEVKLLVEQFVTMKD